MSDRELAEIVYRALLAIAAGIRKRYNLPDHRNVVIVLQDQPQEITLPEPIQKGIVNEHV
ncbi:MAG TPA: hypothetical protein VFM05_03840 [Candidatus Saccharimonadales bacterium]|nr:hypothetical protein [Candidatus Saccharimonadales bacterium]